MEENKKDEVIVEEEQVETTAEVKVEDLAQPKVSTWTKVKTFGKHHGKKVAIGAATLAAGVLGYILGKGNGDSSIYYGDDFDEDAIAAEENSTEETK